MNMDFTPEQSHIEAFELLAEFFSILFRMLANRKQKGEKNERKTGS